MDANSGAIKWKLKLGIDERNACPLFADGKLYVPMLDDPASKATGEADAGTTGAFLHHQTAARRKARCCATSRWRAAVSARRWPITASFTCRPHATSIAGEQRATIPGAPHRRRTSRGRRPGPATQLQVIPSEVLLHPGEKATFRVRSLDANGFTVEESIPAKEVKWAQLHAPDREGQGGDEGRVSMRTANCRRRRTPCPRRARSRPRWAL